MPFVKGQSGNPSGRPKVIKEIQELARQHTTAALQTLVEICGNPDAKESARVSAASVILDRAYGKPMQPSEVSGPDGSPLLDGIKIILTRPNDRG